MGFLCYMIQMAFIRDEKIERGDSTVINIPMFHIVLLHDPKPGTGINVCTCARFVHGFDSHSS